jgi:hypothetical protein
MSPLAMFLVVEGALVVSIGGIVVAVMVGDLLVRTVRRMVGR